MKTDSSVWGWGSNAEGELGDGTSNTNTLTPIRASGLETVNAPAFNPSGGTFPLAVNVTVTCPTPGATIHYTLNGSEPTESDPVIASGGILRLTSQTSVRARTWKPGLVPSVTSFGHFEVEQPPPELVLEENGPVSTQLGAVDSVLLLRDPFSIVNTGNPLRKAGDPNTRILFFVLNLQLLPGETADAVQINLTGNGTTFFLKAEDVRFVPGVELTQVVLRLPNGATPGTYQVQLFAHGQVSNFATIRIKP